MTKNLRLLLASLCLLGAAVWTALSQAPAQAESKGPDAQGWWFIANQGPLAAPPPPGVGPHDLFIEGSKGNAGAPPAEPPAPFPSGVASRGAARAIAAVRYTIPEGAIVDRVKFKFAGSPPASGSVSVQACRTTGPFKAEQDGPWTDVPPYDCTVPSIGSLDTDGVVFTDIAGLAQGTTLSFVIVPDYYDYEDLQQPGPDSLSFRGGAGSFDLGSVPAVSSFDTGPVTDTGAVAAEPLPADNVPALPPLPQDQGASPPAAVPRPNTARAATPALAHLDDRTARVVAGSGLGLSLLAFALLMASESQRARRLLGLRIATSGPAQQGRGLGRFVEPREGRAPALW